MLHRTIWNIFTLSCVFGLLVTTLTAMAGGNSYQYSLRLAGGDYNPWAMPQVYENSSDFQQPLKHGRQPGRYQRQQDRFITEEFVESLEQQQSRYQVMPENRPYHQVEPRQSIPLYPGLVPGTDIYGYPSYGGDYLNPLYDAPATLPWGGTPDILYPW